MRRLADPNVLRSAILAALLTTLACAPRVLLWTTRPYTLGYLEAVLFFGSIVLWAFVFAWHTPYSRRPVLTFKVDATIGAMATFAGLAVATVLFLFYDPVFRLRTPLDYPRNVEQWIAIVLFDLSFNQLFLTFAPLAWLLRLTQNLRAAIVLTVLFGIVVLLIKVGRSPIPPSTGLFIELVLVRLVIGVCTILFYLRGGLLLAWWWGFLLDARHLLALGNAPAGS